MPLRLPKPNESISAERELAEIAASFQHKPYECVMAFLPWGEANTPLFNKQGPLAWQRESLMELGDDLQSGKLLLQDAKASGHGIGKSAEVSLVTLWGISTFADTRGVITANTENQLTTKTWAEIAKWYQLWAVRHWFKYNATSIHSVQPGHEKTWRVDASPWSENNTEAFAGLHNEGKRLLLIMDEASAIADRVWEVAEGAMTDDATEIIWRVRGNPTRNSGRFRECFGRNSHRWRHKQIDSRDAEITNKEKIQQWIDDYGEDSDFVRVRVRGVFPRSGSMQFQPSEAVTEAMRRPLPDESVLKLDPVVLGVDVARYGDDESVICPRRGRDAKSIPWVFMRETDTMTLASKVAEVAQKLGAKAIFVDEGGMGVAVVDRLRQLRVPGVVGVNFGGKPVGLDIEGEPVKARNRATEMAVARRAWLKHGCIPNDAVLETQLIDREYGYDGINNAIVLESKEHMKQVRSLSSPDRGDALDLTFASPVLPDTIESAWFRDGGATYETDYRMF